MSGAHVLVARLDNVGDVLLTGPAVRAIADRAEVSFVAGPAGAPAARLLPGVRDVLVYDAPWVGYQPSPLDADATLSLVGDLAGRRFDAALVFTSFHQSPLPLALLARLAGIPWVGATCVDYPGSLLDLRRAPEPANHEVEEALALAAAAGFPAPEGDHGRLAVSLPAPAASPRGPVLGRPSPPPERRGSHVVIHPGASVPARAVALDLARDAARVLAGRGWSVSVTGSPAEAEACARVASGTPGVTDRSGTRSLVALAEELVRAAAVVCGTTGPAHLAAALGVPVASVFAPVVPWHRWRPWGVPAERLGVQEIECAGCRARSCPRPGQPCTASIRGVDVADAVERLTRKTRPVEAVEAT
jgi:ADP-heptose:LPS heptosyltransferase